MAAQLAWKVKMKAKELRPEVLTKPKGHDEQTEIDDFTRRDFVNKSATAIGACALGVAGLVSKSASGATPVWVTIPDQQWEVGESVFLDLSEFVTDPDGDSLTFGLDMVLPPGVTLNGSVISGIPTTEFPSTQYVATADDDVMPPAPPSGLRAE